MKPRREQFYIALRQLNELYADVPVPERMVEMVRMSNEISY